MGGHCDLSVLHKLPLAAVLRIDWGVGGGGGQIISRQACEEADFHALQDYWGLEHGGCHGDGEK